METLLILLIALGPFITALAIIEFIADYFDIDLSRLFKP